MEIKTDDKKENFSRLKEVESLALQETLDNINRKQKVVDDYVALMDRLKSLPNRLSYDIMVPFGGRAFMPGSLRNTNSVTILLGDNWFAKVSTSHAVSIVARRVVVLTQSIEGLTKQKELLQNDLKATEDFVELQKSDDVVEIKEDYDEEEDLKWRKKRKAAGLGKRLVNDSVVLKDGKRVDNNMENNIDLNDNKEIITKDEKVETYIKSDNEVKCSEIEKEEIKRTKEEIKYSQLETNNMGFLESHDDEDGDDEDDTKIWTMIDELSKTNDDELEGEGLEEGDVVQRWVSMGVGEGCEAGSVVLVGDFSDGEDTEEDKTKDENNNNDEKYDENLKLSIKKTIRFKHTCTRAVMDSQWMLPPDLLSSPFDIYNSFKSAQKKKLKKRVSFSESVSFLDSEENNDQMSHTQNTSSLLSSSLPSSLTSSSSSSNEKPTKTLSRFKQERLKLKQNM